MNFMLCSNLFRFFLLFLFPSFFHHSLCPMKCPTMITTELKEEKVSTNPPNPSKQSKSQLPNDPHFAHTLEGNRTKQFHHSGWQQDRKGKIRGQPGGCN